MRAGDSTVKSFASIFEDISTMMQRIGGCVQKPRIHVGKSAHRASAAADEDVESYYRINVFSAAVDDVLTDIRDRFGEHVKLSACLCCLVPNLVMNKEWTDFELAHKKYKHYI